MSMTTLLVHHPDDYLCAHAASDAFRRCGGREGAVLREEMVLFLSWQFRLNRPLLIPATLRSAQSALRKSATVVVAD